MQDNEVVCSLGMTQDVPVSSPYFLLTYIFMSCFVSVCLWNRLQVGRLSWSDWGSDTGILNITCSMDTTSGLLFSLCNWADNVPWFLLFCTSICSAWAARCILVSWKLSGVNERSGNPPSLLQFCRWANGIATAAAGQTPQRAELIHCPGPWEALL